MEGFYLGDHSDVRQVELQIYCWPCYEGVRCGTGVPKHVHIADDNPTIEYLKRIHAAQMTVVEAARAYLQAWERNRKVEHDESVSDDEWYAANQAVLGAWSEFVEAVKRLEEVDPHDPDRD